MAQHSRFGNPHLPGPQRRVSAHYHPQHPQPLVYGTPESRSSRSRRSLNAPPPRQGNRQPKGVLLAGGSMLALAALVVTPSMNQTTDSSSVGSRDVCIKQIDDQALISRDELKELLDLEQQSPQAQVQEIVESPHCVLEAKIGENGTRLEREAYPLEFDPQTWFVVQYQDGKYAGFDFSFR